MPDVLTIREAVQRAKAEGMPCSEYAIRQWVKSGAIPTRKVGQKALLYFPNLVRYLQCEDGADNVSAPSVSLSVRGIRQIDL